MKKYTIIILSILLLALAVSPASAIISGEPDFEHTNVGAIMMEWPTLEEVEVGRLCSGTLIHEQVLLTAAHCHKSVVNQGISFDQIWITFDQNPFDENVVYLDVVDFIPHPEFMITALDSHDIALVILAEPVEGIDPVPLPDLGYFDKLVNQTKWRKLALTAVGYGIFDLENNTIGAFHLDAERRSAPINFQSLEPYEINFAQLRRVNAPIPHMGDSGGPLFHVDHGKNEVLVGSFSCISSCNDKSVYYRLDTESAQEFIANTIEDYFSEE